MISKKVGPIIILILLISLFSGCMEDRQDEVRVITREFIKDYIHNPETIQFNNETIHTIATGVRWDVYGSGTVIYEGSRRSFSYYISVSYQNDKFECILKQLIIGEV
jgi:hypothetical protein